MPVTVVSGIYVLAIAGLSYSDVTREFGKASMDFSQYGTMLVPLDCNSARGRVTDDYTVAKVTPFASLCWYELPKFRALFPETQKMTDSEVSDSYYTRAGIPTSPARPW